MKKERLKKLIDVAAGRLPADLVLTNGKIIDVYNARLMDGDVAIVDGVIAGIGGHYNGKTVVDIHGQFISPGFIDPHIHVESAYVSPEEFGRLMTPHGTTTVMADPHEIVNVAGLTGLDYMINAAKETALDIQYMLPSCVPATKMENSGAVISAGDMIEPLTSGETKGLAEFMDFPGVINTESDILDKLLVATNLNKRIDGHSPQVYGKDLNAYIAAGIQNDHECSTLEELQDRLSRGMYVFLREGSVTHNLRTLLKGVTPNNSRRTVLCGDDVQAKTIIEKGHLDNSLKICVEEGVDPLVAIQMATLNTAECCELKDRGAVAPGLRADLAIISDLTEMTVSSVYIAGEKVAEAGSYLLETKSYPIDSVQSSVHLANFSQDKLVLPLTSNRVHAIEVIPNEAITLDREIDVNRDAAGNFVYDSSIPVAKISVIERHHETGNVFTGVLKDYGIKEGAIAISIAHDSHNLITAGTNDQDMALAVTALKDIQGGMVLTKNKQVLMSIPLPIGGLMSDQSGEWVTAQLEKFNEVAYKELGINHNVDPVMTLSFMSLAVIPELKITDMGLVNVSRFEFEDVSV
ncbi:adenine deaminase [Dellaglioa algida]|uniref:adenine deaminase n=1 Tax=Dellaglioa algida TaxID=105612 RepID=UPI000BC663F7|nr:adenine deaminase [Dellaglioa algida]MDK1729345.1 adenine deaminase [Dellaglioa algida]MDK1741780.1 adenine deaminase [Dellaglioa algida]SOB50867.1 Adenine deaminase [Dellaglioa algida]